MYVRRQPSMASKASGVHSQAMPYFPLAAATTSNRAERQPCSGRSSRYNAAVRAKRRCLARSHRVQAAAPGAVAAKAHFDEDQRLAIQHHEIDLAGTSRIVARQRPPARDGRDSARRDVRPGGRASCPAGVAATTPTARPAGLRGSPHGRGSQSPVGNRAAAEFSANAALVAPNSACRRCGDGFVEFRQPIELVDDAVGITPSANNGAKSGSSLASKTVACARIPAGLHEPRDGARRACRPTAARRRRERLATGRRSANRRRNETPTPAVGRRAGHRRRAPPPHRHLGDDAAERSTRCRANAPVPAVGPCWRRCRAPPRRPP